MEPRNDVYVFELSLSLLKCKNEADRVSDLLSSFLPAARKELDVLFRKGMELTNKQAHNIS